MNWIGSTLIVIGIVYLISSYVRKEEMTYYVRRYLRISEVKFIKPNEFYRMQFMFALLNTIYLIIIGALVIILNLPSIVVILGLIGFHFINFLVITQGKKKGYIYYD